MKVSPTKAKKRRGKQKVLVRRKPRVEGNKVQWANSEAKDEVERGIYGGLIPVIKDDLGRWSIGNIDAL